MMKDIYDYGKLISENEFKAIIIKEIYFNNLVSYVNEIEVSDRVPFARYYCDRKKLCFNFDAILRNTLIKASKHSFNSKKEKIMYLNCNIISVIFHEIAHVCQKKEENPLIILSEQTESELKIHNLYDVNLYLVNPIERQANILSLSKIVCDTCPKNTHINDLFKQQLIKIIKYGYDETFPIYIFFKDSNNFEDALYFSSSSLSEFDEKLEYGSELTYDEYKKIMELKL